MENILQKVKKVIRKAGIEIMKKYGADNKITKKKDKTFVTEVDFLSEKIILEGLKEFDYGILSEESLGSLGRDRAKRVWVVDPIDGTMEFIKETGEFSIMIGLAEDGKSILGVVYQPVLDKLYYATLGGGAYLENKGITKKLEVLKSNDCSEFVMLGSRHHMRALEVRLCNELRISDFIIHGSAGLKMCLIAEQKADIYINSSNKTAEWDICAGDIIVSEAGGRVTDMNGNDFVYNKEDYLNLDGFVVSNGLQHHKIIKKIKDIR